MRRLIAVFVILVPLTFGLYVHFYNYSLLQKRCKHVVSTLHRIVELKRPLAIVLLRRQFRIIGTMAKFQHKVRYLKRDPSTKTQTVKLRLELVRRCMEHIPEVKTCLCYVNFDYNDHNHSPLSWFPIIFPEKEVSTLQRRKRDNGMNSGNISAVTKVVKVTADIVTDDGDTELSLECNNDTVCNYAQTFPYNATGYILLSFIAISIILNSLNIMIYVRKSALKANITLMIAVNSIDVLGNTSVLLAIFIPFDPNERSNDGTPFSLASTIIVHLPGWFYRLSNVLIATISLERFLTLRSPIDTSRNLIGRNQKKVVITEIFLLMGCCTSEQIKNFISPRYFNISLLGGSDNCTVNETLDGSATTMRTINITSVVNTVIFSYTMILSILFLNALTVKVLAKEANIRKSLGHTCSAPPTQARRTTKILTMVTSLYVLFGILRIVLRGIGYLYYINNSRRYSGLSLYRAGIIFDLIANSSDFFVVLSMSKQFRESLLRTCHSRKETCHATNAPRTDGPDASL